MIINILVVDDEPINQRIIEESFDGTNYKITSAENGKEALDILSKSEISFSAIILDRLMPVMDGMKFLSHLKSISKFADIPVIMQTAVGSASDIIDGLQAGAFYYLTKPYSRKVLLKVTFNAVDHYHRWLRAKEELVRGLSAASFIKEANFEIQTFKDVIALSPLLANTCPHPDRVLTGILEILNNAIEHGNMGITFEEKTKLYEADKLTEEIEIRSKDPIYSSRKVHVHFVKSETEITITIRDEGVGFNWRDYENAEKIAIHANLPHGRGIYMAKQLSFDSLTYIGNGNTAVIKISLEK